MAEAKAGKQEIIYRSKLPAIHIPKHLPLHTYCLGSKSEKDSQRPCLINGPTNEVFTYADVSRAARRVASGLRSLGVGRGDVVMVLLPNSPEFILTFLGASHLGAATTAANPFCTAAEIAKQAEASGARLVVTTAAGYEKVKGVRAVIVGEAVPEGCVAFSEISGAEALADEAEIDPDDVVALPYSSGTTGLPKGVMLTHKGLVTSVAQQVLLTHNYSLFLSNFFGTSNFFMILLLQKIAH